jgi:hypothetical protein
VGDQPVELNGAAELTIRRRIFITSTLMNCRGPGGWLQRKNCIKRRSPAKPIGDSAHLSMERTGRARLRSIQPLIQFL